MNNILEIFVVKFIWIVGLLNIFLQKNIIDWLNTNFFFVSYNTLMHRLKLITKGHWLVWKCEKRHWLTNKYYYWQQTRDAHPMLVQCWPIVCDAGTTLYQYWASVPRLLGWLIQQAAVLLFTFSYYPKYYLQRVHGFNYETKPFPWSHIFYMEHRNVINRRF